MPIRNKSAAFGCDFFVFNALIIAAVGCVFGFKTLYSLGLLSVWSGGQILFFLGFSLGQFFLFLFVLSILFALILRLFRLPKATFIAVLLLNALFLCYLAADSYVFPLYRTHLNGAMLEMTLLGGGRIVNFSFPMLIEIGAIILSLILIAAVGIRISWFLSQRLRYERVLAVIAFFGVTLLFIGLNARYALAFAQFDTAVTSITEKIPFSRPLRMNSKIYKWGLVDKEIRKETQLTESTASDMRYPLELLKCKGGERFNILFLFVDTLRYDMLTPEVMPKTFAFAKENIQFTDHYSNGNNTRHGIFSLFTGLPGFYWKKSLTSGTPGILITALQEADYNIGIFTGAPLDLPEFHKTIFSRIKDLKIYPRGKSSVESDQFAVEDFEKWQKSLKNGEPFFGFIFLDSVHAYSFPKTPEFEVFKPYWKEVNHLELNNSFDPAQYIARYKNAVRYSDKLVGNVLDYLKKENLLDKTIVVISSDHGDEFNDNHLNYWSHGGNFTDPQVKVPLVVHWPGKKAGVVNYLTSHLDLVPTILPEVLGCSNPTRDYSVGQSIWDEKNRRNWFYASGYSQDGFVEPKRIVLINRAGILEYVDRHYRPTKDTSIPPYLPTVLEEGSRYAR